MSCEDRDAFNMLWHHIVYDLPLGHLEDRLIDPDMIARARALLTALEQYRRRNTASNPYERVEKWHLWELYALSRINDFLLFPYLGQNAPMGLQQLRGRFFEALGFHRIDVPEGEPYSPMHHEIVGTWPAKDEPGIPIVRHQEWPGLMWGTLVFARAGVFISAAQRHIDPAIANRATLLFAYRRHARPTYDLSFGWGSNSQWTTDFRRDYVEDETFHFNVDGRIDLASEETFRDGHARRVNPEYEPLPKLPLDARRELLVHRQFVRSRYGIEDDWVWDDKWSVPASYPFWSE